MLLFLFLDSRLVFILIFNNKNTLATLLIKLLIIITLLLQLGNYPKPINAFRLNDWFNSEKQNPIIIDVREDSELQIACFSKQFLHMPISKVSLENVQEKIGGVLNRQIVVICHAGIRSYNFAQWALENNLLNEIWNLEEGIDGWSRYVDPTIPRY